MYWLQHKLSTEDTLDKLSTSATRQHCDDLGDQPCSIDCNTSWAPKTLWPSWAPQPRIKCLKCLITRKRAWITSERLCSVAVCLVQRHKHQQTVHRRHTNATIIIIGRFIEGMEVHSIDYSTQLRLMRHSVIWRIFIRKWKNKKKAKIRSDLRWVPRGSSKKLSAPKNLKNFFN